MPSNSDTERSNALATINDQARGLMDTLGIRLSDPAELQWEIAARTADAQTAEDLFGEGGPLGLREHLGESFLVTRVRYMPSSFVGGPPVYAIIDGVNPETDEPVLYTTGSVSVLIQLARAVQMGWLDKPVKAKAADQPTADGNIPYRLVFA